MYRLLSGLSLIEVASFVAGPTAGLYCAQMGADVIRVDRIGGGPDFRRWPVTSGNDSLYWENLNRAKMSVALNLSVPEGRELLQQLVRVTGQFITRTSSRPMASCRTRLWPRGGRTWSRCGSWAGQMALRRSTIP